MNWSADLGVAEKYGRNYNQRIKPMLQRFFQKQATIWSGKKKSGSLFKTLLVLRKPR
jgi:hypothetical protein